VETDRLFIGENASNVTHNRGLMQCRLTVEEHHVPCSQLPPHDLAFAVL
jgi:hypothetical protein